MNNEKPFDETQIGHKAKLACKEYSQYAVDPDSYSIVYGVQAVRNEIPHMVALGYRNKKNSYDFDCGGTLIAQQWIVTAAHCITEKRMPVIVRMGTVRYFVDWFIRQFNSIQ